MKILVMIFMLMGSFAYAAELPSTKKVVVGKFDYTGQTVVPFSVWVGSRNAILLVTPDMVNDRLTVIKNPSDFSRLHISTWGGFIVSTPLAVGYTPSFYLDVASKPYSSLELTNDTTIWARFEPGIVSSSMTVSGITFKK